MNKSALKLLSAWLIVLVGVLGSLYFSDIKGFVPCVLCWYQRIAMYPLAVILPLVIVKKDWQAVNYIIPLTFIGAVIALYQNLLVWRVIPTSGLCGGLSDCANGYINWFGFITLPLLSLVSFIIIIMLLTSVRRAVK